MKIVRESFSVPSAIIGIIAGLALIIVCVAYAAEPEGLEVGPKTGIHGHEAVAYYGARCGEQFALWVLTDNGHLIYFDDKDGAVVGELLKQLAGKPSDFHDFCSSSL